MASGDSNKHVTSDLVDEDARMSKHEITSHEAKRDSGNEEPCKDGARDALDGGWGWAIVLGSALAQCFFSTVFLAYGMLYQQSLDMYGEGGTKTSIPFTLAKVLCWLPGPAYGIFVDRYGVRLLTFTGTVLMSAGLIASAWAPSLAWFIVFFGVLQGIGSGMVVMSSVIIVHQYFEHRKSLAMAISSLGLTVSNISSPFITSALLDCYGMKGTLLIFGGLSLNGCVSSAIFIPPSKMLSIETIKKARLKRLTHPGYNSSLVSPEQPHINHKRLCKDSRAASTGSETMHSPMELNEMDNGTPSQKLKKMFSGVCNIPLTLHCLMIAGIMACFATYVAFLPGLSEELGIYHAPLLLSLTGIDGLGRLFSGFLFDIPWVIPRRPHFFAVFGMALAALTALIPTMKTLAPMCVVIGLGAAFMGATFGQKFTLVTDYVLPKYITFAMGVASTVHVVGFLISIPVGGALLEHAGTYTLVFYIIAGLLGSIALANFVYYAYIRPAW